MQPLLPPLILPPLPAPLPMQRRLQLPLQLRRSRNSFRLTHMPERTAIFGPSAGLCFLEACARGFSAH
jgi:hypothetical protein